MGKADIYNPLRYLLMNAGCFSACQKGFPLTKHPRYPRLRLDALETVDCLSAFKITDIINDLTLYHNTKNITHRILPVLCRLSRKISITSLQYLTTSSISNMQNIATVISVNITHCHNILSC